MPLARPCQRRFVGPIIRSQWKEKNYAADDSLKWFGQYDVAVLKVIAEPLVQDFLNNHQKDDNKLPGGIRRAFLPLGRNLVKPKAGITG